jgi:hypothetical protein
MRSFEKRLERLEERFKFSKVRVSHAKEELKQGLDLMRSRYLEAGEAFAMDVEEIGKLKKSILERIDVNMKDTFFVRYVGGLYEAEH